MKKPGYNENLEMLRDKFPGRATITAKECAEILGINEQTVYRMGQRVKQPLPVKKFGGKVLVPITGLASWLS